MTMIVGRNMNKSEMKVVMEPAEYFLPSVEKKVIIERISANEVLRFCAYLNSSATSHRFVLEISIFVVISLNSDPTRVLCCLSVTAEHWKHRFQQCCTNCSRCSFVWFA